MSSIDLDVFVDWSNLTRLDLIHTFLMMLCYTQVDTRLLHWTTPVNYIIIELPVLHKINGFISFNQSVIWL
jgi:hypothetical protein